MAGGAVKLTKRQRYALTHPLDDAHMDAHRTHCTRITVLPAAELSMASILAVDR